MEMFIIGRNFDKNTSVLFREYTDSKRLNNCQLIDCHTVLYNCTLAGTMCWSAEAEIQKPFFHQCHIVCSIPEYPHKHQGGTVSMTVKCGQKQSHPTEFVYTPSETRPRPFYNGKQSLLRRSLFSFLISWSFTITNLIWQMRTHPTKCVCYCLHDYKITFQLQSNFPEEQEDEWCPPGSPRSTLKRQWYNSSGASQWDAQSAYDMPYFEYEQPNDYFRNRDDSEESGKKPRHSQH